MRLNEGLDSTAPRGFQPPRRRLLSRKAAAVNDLAHNRHLFIEDLARRLQALESGQRRMNALDYRVHARMLRHALAGIPQRQLQVLMTYGVVCEVLDNRGFDEAGLLQSAGPEARALRKAAQALIRRVQQDSRGTV
jgi:hypothetical protein